MVRRIASVVFAAIVLPLLVLGQEDATFRKGELVRREAAAAEYLHKSSTTLSPGQEGYDALYYKLDLTLSLNPNRLSGSMTMQACALVNNLSSISLDLMSAMKIDSVFVGGTKVTAIQQPRLATIALDRPYQTGERFSVVVFYGGVPGSSGFGSFVFTSTTSGSPWVWSLSEPYGAKDWWPSKDHPSDKADSVDIWITCDSRFKVGSEGTLVATIDNGDGTKTHKWKHRYPIATYLVSIAVAEYSEVTGWFKYSSKDSMPIVNYVLPSMVSSATGALNSMVTMLNIFSDLFGLYPFIKEKYGHSQFGWGGGMEHQTMTSLVSFSEGLVAHEMAHQWFGDMITMSSWPHIWLNEGFATYSVALYQERKIGSTGYWNVMNSEMSSARNAQGSIYVRDTSSVSRLFNGSLVYSKGATVLHMLRHVMGDSSFFRALRAYAQDHRFQFGTATTEDFRSVCESYAGGKSLGYFFTQWIYGESFPKYNFQWGSTQIGSSYRSRVTINQTTGTTNPSFFTMPLDLRFRGLGLDTTMKVMNDQQGQTFVFTLPALPTELKLDPDNWILKDAVGTLVSVEDLVLPPQTFQLFQNYPNPFNPSTLISFELPSASSVRLEIFDQLGRRVRTMLDDQHMEAGRHMVTLSALDEFGLELPSGVYYARLSAPGYPIRTSKLVCMR